MSETSKRGLTRHKNIVFRRNHAQLEQTIKMLKSSGQRFDVLHSSYSTSIEFEDKKKILYTTFSYRDKVFQASRCIVKDLKENPLADVIRGQEWPKINFDSKNGWEPKKCKAVINIDISKAYASCLLNSGLIKPNTFQFLNSLRKYERLPAVGMIAKRGIVYRYNQGECISFDKVEGEWTQIFFYIIAQVNSVMQDCQRIAGKDYCFHWVDGIFVDHRIDKQKLKDIELCLEDAGYSYKYEKCENFSAYRDGDKVHVSMTKNDEPKNYCFRDPNFMRNYLEMLERIRLE